MSGPGEIITAVIPFRLHISVSSGYLTIVSHCFLQYLQDCR